MHPPDANGSALPATTEALPRPAREAAPLRCTFEGAAQASGPVAASRLRIDACVILAGGLKPSPLAAATGVSVLDLPLQPGRSVSDIWIQHLREVFVGATNEIELVLAYTANIPVPAEPAVPPAFRLSRASTPAGLRGPAGSVYDVCAALPGAAQILVMEGNRYLTRGLGELLQQHETSGADVTVACNPDRTPAGIYVLRRPTLDLIQPLGFMDLKEQWLKKVAEGRFSIRVHHLTRGHAYPLRTWRLFRGAARVANGLPFDVPFLDQSRTNGHLSASVRGAETLRIVAEGAEVSEKALVMDSIVLAGARVEPGAVVVRSLLGPGAVVGAGSPAVDTIVTRDRRVSEQEPWSLGRRRLRLGRRSGDGKRAR